MEKKWGKTPKHILRTKCIEYLSHTWTPGSFVEFGAGTGDITRLFLDQGYYGKCYDLGERNRAILRNNLATYGGQAEVVDSRKMLGNVQFDYLFAFEVLEHIKNDDEVFGEWSQHLKGGGKVLISVPAHQDKFSEEDDWAGHIRRYEKAQLVDLLRNAGYTNVTVLNYGFPLGNLSRWVSKLLHQGVRENEPRLSAEDRSIKSGVERIEGIPNLAFLFNEVFMMPFCLIQRLFFRRDWGDGYVACATKK